MKRIQRTTALLFTTLALGALSGCGAPAPIEGCEAVGDIQPHCQMQAPEDIAALNDGRYLLLAHFGGMDEGAGSISLFDTQTAQRKPLFPSATAAGPAQELWGDASCTTPPGEAFSPHGTHLHQLDDGQWRYLVVNHGSREAVELFELDNAGGDSTLRWRGCVFAAPDTFMNDVVGLDNGDVIYTRMFKTGGGWELVKSLAGFPSGDVWRWNQDTGLRVLPGTEAAQPNGIEISEDNRHVFANMYLEKEVWKLDADTGEVLATASLSNADNSAWGTDGRLWIASHTSVLELIACFEVKEQPCGAAFEIIALDPEDMSTEVLFAWEGAPMGAATVAVPQNGRVYIGSFAGDRLVSVPDFTAQ